MTLLRSPSFDFDQGRLGLAAGFGSHNHNAFSVRVGQSGSVAVPFNGVLPSHADLVGLQAKVNSIILESREKKGYFINPQILTQSKDLNRSSKCV